MTHSNRLTSIPSRLAGLLSTALIIAMTLIPAAPASAQLGAVAQAMEPEYFTRDLLIFIEGLDLDETQAVIAEAIFDDYEQKFHDGKDQMEMEINSLTSELQAMRGQVDNDKLLEMVVQPIQDWMVRRQGLNDQLIENVRVILVPEQQDLWTNFARKLYREKKLDDGRLSGERVDLYVIARDLDIDTEKEPIRETMFNYAIQLNQALRARQLLLEGDSKDLLNTLRNRQSDPNVDMGTRKKIEAARLVVRDTNDRYREEIAVLLGSPIGDRFRQETLRRAYPKIYRTGNAERVYRDAMELYGPEGERSDEQIFEAIMDLYNEFQLKLQSLNTQMYNVTRSSEPELELARIENAMRRANGQETLRPEDPMRPLQQERRELERTYIDKLRALLGDEQFKDLNGARRYMPAPTFDPDNPNMGNNGDGRLQLQGPSGGTKGGPKETKPDSRPDKPPVGLGQGQGLGKGDD